MSKLVNGSEGQRREGEQRKGARQILDKWPEGRGGALAESEKHIKWEEKGELIPGNKDLLLMIFWQHLK